uniref:Uncharacterized protein n=1 Tax=Romanomermis culicivorax TaxID=13658 RepID=A0A915JVB9_ROMCU
MLVAGVDWLGACISKAVAETFEDDGKASSTSGSSEDWELA